MQLELSEKRGDISWKSFMHLWNTKLCELEAYVPQNSSIPAFEYIAGWSVSKESEGAPGTF